MTSAISCTQVGIKLDGQVKPLKMNAGVAITINISVACNFDGKTMLTNTPIKHTASIKTNEHNTNNQKSACSGISYHFPNPHYKYNIPMDMMNNSIITITISSTDIS